MPEKNVTAETEMKQREKAEAIFEQKGLPDGMSSEMQLWDEIAKKIVFVMPGMVLPLIQEIYDKEYPRDAEIRPLATEYSVERKGMDEISSIRADLVILVENADIYHFELQMKRDGEMVMRMFEYDVHTAISYARMNQDGTGYIEFPRSTVLYLQGKRKIPDFLQATVTFQDGSSHLYQVPTMKVQTYTLKEIKEKHLTFLIPFVPLRFRNRLHSEKNAVKSEELTSFYDEIMVMLNQEVENGYLSETQRTMVVSLLRKSMIRVFYKDETLVKEVLRLTEPILKFEWEDLEKELQEERKKSAEERQKHEEERQKHEEERQKHEEERKRFQEMLDEREAKGETRILDLASIMAQKGQNVDFTRLKEDAEFRAQMLEKYHLK